MSQFHQIPFSRCRREEKNVLANREQGSHLDFLIGLKNTNLVEAIEILLLFKFCQIPFSVFRGEVKNVPFNQRPGRSSWFSDRPNKHKIGRGCWDLASCQVSSNCIQQRRSRKCLSQSEAWWLSWFSDPPKNTNLVEDVKFLLPVEFCQILFRGFRDRRSRKCEKLTMYRQSDDGWQTTDNTWSQSCAWAFGSGVLKSYHDR